MSEALEQLCRRCGVLDEYRDIWGQAHAPSDATRRALLAAMGVAAESDADIARALDDFDRREWTRPLPPVRVLREDERPCRITIALPEGTARRRLRWCLAMESGAEESGEFSLAELEEAGRRELDGRVHVRRVLALDLTLEPGYHGFFLEAGAERLGAMSLIVAPATCYQPQALNGDGRAWGFAAQLYGIRSERNWGMGDFGDLRRMVEFCGESGAGTLLLNPLHALFPDAPEHASPYSPSHRAFFNTLYLDIPAMADFVECAEARTMVHAPAFQARLRALRAAAQVDYQGVAELKAKVLGLLHAHFRDHQLARNGERAQSFRAFQAEQGANLHGQALFETLQEHFRAGDAGVWGWPAWPEAYRDPEAPEVAAFMDAHRERVEFFEYLQWQAATQLAAAGTRSWELGLDVGIMFDLAVGVAEGGAATWMRRDLYALGASTGAPPDEINRMGQDWGLPPLIPWRLTEAAYEPFIEVLRANMRDAGALRIDHVMGLFRLFWVARGLPAADGAYVAYPFADLLGILALESRRNRCLVLGEDLGTVPDEVREALGPMGVLSTRLLYFERLEDGRLKSPQAYPVEAAVAATSHDLPTLAGFWQGLDIDLRERLHLFPDHEVRNHQVVARSQDRAQLLLALEGEGVLPPGAGLHPEAHPEMSCELAAAVYAYLARAPSKLLLMQMEDGFGVREQPNLPGTTAPSYPCWRLKLPLNLDEWQASAWLQGIVQALRRERPPRQAPAGGPGGALRLWIPRATYRLQLNSDFNLRQATELLPYLDELGVSHCYLSPILKARPGSRHGYDITDHSCLNPEIAGSEEFERFVLRLRRRGMGLIMDVVPNHMGIMGADNGWWLDVLENGPASRFAGHFDIDWQGLASNQAGRVLLPVLGDHYGAVLESGGLRLVFDAERGEFSVFYYQHRFPVDPREYPRILAHGLDRLRERLGGEDPALLEFQTLLTAFAHLPARDRVDAAAVAERARDKEGHKRHLAALCAGSADIAQFIGENLDEFNSAASFDPLHELIEAQAYRPAYWRVAADEINYRRFFDINDLAALSMDDPEVFAATHRLLRELIARGYVQGLRIDHPDGLYEPRVYFARLQAMAASLAADPAEERPLYLVVEKILASHERLPESWAIHGTTGYDFAAACGALFVDARNEDRFSRIYQGFIRARPDFDAMSRANKHLIMETALAGELRVLASQLTRLAKADRHTCDFTYKNLRGALAEIVAAFPVYRTYVSAGEPSPDDVRYVDWAVGVAKKRSQAADTSIFDFVREVLLARRGEGAGEDYRLAVRAFAMKFQQYSSPLMAKAMEDTSFYQYNRLLCLNEVGGDPRRFGLSPAAFHRENQERARHWPHALLAGSTHDSKRSEDVRARLAALSELPDAWQRVLARWGRLNRHKRRRLDNGDAPSRNDEYLLYQTLLGAWPFGLMEATPDAGGLARFTERIEAYMLKAGREAKLHTSWINPDPDYEAATRDFVRALLAPDPGNLFLRDFLPFQQRVAGAGALTSLAQLLLRFTAPGVPDIYQGCELWDFSLVDPDNRRPVDYAARFAVLRSLKAAQDGQGVAGCARELLENFADGRIKLYLIWKTLALRRECEALFRDGDYLPLRTHGAGAEQVFAFARQGGGESLVVLVPRLLAGLMGEECRLPIGATAWGDTWVELAPEHLNEAWINVLTGERVSTLALHESQGLMLARVFDDLPFALLLADRVRTGETG